MRESVFFRLLQENDKGTVLCQCIDVPALRCDNDHEYILEETLPLATDAPRPAPQPRRASL